MTTLEDASPRVYRTIVAGVVAYFLVLGYASITGSALAALVANALFGLIALGVGMGLYLQSSRQLEPIAVAATCLVVGGATQLLWLLTGMPELDLLASLTVFSGVLIYVYAIYVA